MSKSVEEACHKSISQMTKKYMKICIISVVIRKMQNRATVGCHYLSTKMAKIKKMDNIKFCQRCGTMVLFWVFFGQ